MDFEDMTVEEYLTHQFQEMVENLKQHNNGLIKQLREEYNDGVNDVKQLMGTKKSDGKLCLTLKCIGGSHVGQKFRLEPPAGKSEGIFKVGRSTGRNFKDKGVSLYKDKEISTTHAKIEIKNGQVFLMDVRSTNGTLLNGVNVEPLVPLRLKEHDVIIMGTTELKVHISNLDETEID